MVTEDGINLFVVLYMGDTIMSAKLVGGSADADLVMLAVRVMSGVEDVDVSKFANKMFNERYQRVSEWMAQVEKDAIEKGYWEQSGELDVG